MHFNYFVVPLCSIPTAAFYTVRRTEEPSSVNGGDKYARRNGDDSNTQENGHSTNPEDLYTTVNKKCEYTRLVY